MELLSPLRLQPRPGVAQINWFARSKRLAKMRDRGLSKIGKAKQCLVRRFAHLSDSLQASGEQPVLYPRWESNFMGWRLIRKLWRWLKLAHFHLPARGRGTGKVRPHVGTAPAARRRCGLISERI
jgi:hypothetical protein